MKKPVILVIVAVSLIALIAGISAFLLLKKHSSQNTAKEFVLTMETGTVSYKKPKDSSYTKMSTVEVTLPTGSSVKTDKDSFAKVFFKDNSLVSIDQSSEIEIDVQAKKIDINQFLGRTWNRVQSVSSGGEYQVKTPNAIAAVRGTIFGVDVNDNSHSDVFVVQSNVDVSRFEGQGNNSKILETKNIGVDQLAQVIQDSTSFRIETGPIPDSLKNSDWFKRNKIIDDEYEKINGVNGKDFRNQLEQKLQANKDYTAYRFGLFAPSDTTNSNIQSQLQDVANITKINDQSCSAIPISDIQLALDRVSIYKAYINNYQDIYDLLQMLKQSCADGQLDSNEIQQLQAEVNKINGK